MGRGSWGLLYVELRCTGSAVSYRFPDADDGGRVDSLRLPIVDLRCVLSGMPDLLIELCTNCWTVFWTELFRTVKGVVEVEFEFSCVGLLPLRWLLKWLLLWLLFIIDCRRRLGGLINFGAPRWALAGRRLSLFLFLFLLNSVRSGDRTSEDRVDDSLRLVNVVEVIGERKLFWRWTVLCFCWPVWDMVSLRGSRDSLGYSMPLTAFKLSDRVAPLTSIRKLSPNRVLNGKHLDRNGRNKIKTRKNMKR